ncbi:unnamed protein product [Schistosoma margrebowiei]|uniref:Uncharacterized protein n=1 Tax=Schistosoma margrebowiei TaxID=48269 RepID=A0AA85AMR6_9TREM|nr:unnamed protein product [Schistosoma margrebowiei]
MKLVLDNVSQINCTNNSNCTFDHYEKPVVLSGVILTSIGLLIGLIIIFIKKLHSTSIMNILFMVITLIILIIGVGLLNSRTQCLAILLGAKLTIQKRKLEIILFSMWCVFAVIGIVLLFMDVALTKAGALSNHIVLGVSWICWCCTMLIVIVYTAYYLCRSSEEEQSRVMYIIFLWTYEYIALVNSSQFCLNTFIDCHPCNKTMNNTSIGHYE